MDGEKLRAAMAAFDTLSDLPPERREKHEVLHGMDPSTRELVERMLASLDLGESHWLERSVWEQLPADMVDSTQESENQCDHSGTHFGNWRAIRPIGKGGMSVVYLGERADGHFERQVAIKLLRGSSGGKEDQRHLLDEVRHLARLQHRNIATLLDGGLDHNQAWLVMEHVDGLSLIEHCRSRNLSLNECIALFQQAARAVAHAHARLIVHRDLKPSNILVGPDGQVKLVDFGVAGVLDVSVSYSGERPAALFCTPGYAAPEQIAGEPPATAHDVFALGAILYELLCGQPLRSAGVATCLLQCRVPDAHPLPPSRRLQESGTIQNALAWQAGELRPDLDAICLRAAASNPDERYGSAQELVDELDRWKAHHPVQALPVRSGYVLRCWLRRNWLPAMAASIAGLALVVGAGVAWWQAGQAHSAAEMARQQADLVIAEQQRTRSALARAEAIRDFLVGLFQANVSDRPADELPDTATLLREGMERVRQDTTMNSAVRADIMATLGYIYRLNGQHELSRELLGSARAQALELGQEDPELLARVTLYWIDLIADDQPGEVLAHLEDLEERLRLHDPNSELYLRVRHSQARELLYSGQVAEGLDMMREIVSRAQGQPDLPDPLRARFIGGLANALADSGHHEQAAQHYQDAIELKRSIRGPNHRDLALELSNAGNNDTFRGAFGLANERYLEALSIYERIDAEPNPYWGTAHLAFSVSLTWQGRYDEALEHARQGLEIISAYQDLPSIDSYPYTGFRLAYPLLAAARWDEAEPLLMQAEKAVPETAGTRLMRAIVAVGLAQTQCMQGDALHGREYLKRAAALFDVLERVPVEYALLHMEAEALCMRQQGQLVQALEILSNSGGLAGELPPGARASQARREFLAAEIAREVGDAGRSKAFLDEAVRLLHDIGLDQHPLLMGHTVN